MDRKLQDYRDGIVYCLVQYGGLEESEAKRLVDESKLCEPRTKEGVNTLFHETYYFWAMHLLHGRGDPDHYWFHNPDLWPPPEDYYEWLKERFRRKAE